MNQSIQVIIVSTNSNKQIMMNTKILRGRSRRTNSSARALTLAALIFFLISYVPNIAAQHYQQTYFWHPPTNNACYQPPSPYCQPTVGTVNQGYGTSYSGNVNGNLGVVGGSIGYSQNRNSSISYQVPGYYCPNNGVEIRQGPNNFFNNFNQFRNNR